MVNISSIEAIAYGDAELGELGDLLKRRHVIECMPLKNRGEG